MFRAVLVASVLATVLTASVWAQQPGPQVAALGEPSIDLKGAMANVRFASNVPIEAIEGKTAVVLVYASWCPKCNQWSPELFAQLKAAAEQSPVVVFAVNADKITRGARVAVDNGFTGPNIIHGDDPTIVKRLGLESELFKYAVFGPDGKMIDKGSGGSFYTRTEKKDYVLASKVRTGSYPGQFSILKKDMAPEVKQALWPVEMGQPITDKSLLTLRNQMPDDFHDEFNLAIRDFLNKHIKRCQEGINGDVPQQIKAFTLAEVLAKRFGTTPQGRQAQAIVTKFEDDEQFRKELAAAKYYERTLATAQASGSFRSLLKVARRFEGTYYGDLAAKQGTN